MPTPQEILAGLADTAQRFAYVAVVWHLAIFGLVVALVAGWRPSMRAAATMLVAPLVSVAALALVTWSPFNAAVFSVVAWLALAIGWRFGANDVQLGTRWQVMAGTVMVAFGSFYPHFVDSDSLVSYFYRAPTGLLPCPTLALVIGVSVLFAGFGSPGWSTTLAIVGLFYGLFGAFRLGVRIDLLLSVGALALAVVAFEEQHRRTSTKTRTRERFAAKAQIMH
jgi:hypothetical protein